MGRAAPQDFDAVVGFAAGIERGSPAADGLLAALDSRKTVGDGALRARQILEFFPDSAKGVFEQLSKIAHVGEQGGLGRFVVKLGQSQTDAQGAAAVLRYVTTRMNPSQVVQLEVTISGKIVDVIDDSGNLLEFKSLNLETYPEFLARREFEDIRDQGFVFQEFAASQGKTLTLVMENQVPAQWQGLFTDIVGPLLARPGVSFVDGF
jgi:hypothetical protein